MNIKPILIVAGEPKSIFFEIFFKSLKAKEYKKPIILIASEKLLKIEMKKFKFKKKINILNYGISNKTEIKSFYINKHDLTSSLNQINKKNLYLNFKAKLFSTNISEMIKESYDVKIVTLLDLIKKKKLKNIDLLKIDTEGHEEEVLKGLGKKINIIKIILIEIHNDDIYLKYSSSKINKYLVKNKFYLHKRIKFPFTTWEDRIYIKKN